MHVSQYTNIILQKGNNKQKKKPNKRKLGSLLLILCDKSQTSNKNVNFLLWLWHATTPHQYWFTTIQRQLKKNFSKWDYTTLITAVNHWILIWHKIGDDYIIFDSIEKKNAHGTHTHSIRFRTNNSLFNWILSWSKIGNKQ